MKTNKSIRFLAGLGAAMLIALPQGASACAVCFGAPDAPMTKGMAWGILSLLAIILTVLAAVSAFFIFLAKKSATLAASTPHVGLEAATTKA